MASLQEFYKDHETRDNVHEYLKQYLEQDALKRLFVDRTDVSTVAEARDIIDKAFENLDNMFSSPLETKETINEAR